MKYLVNRETKEHRIFTEETEWFGNNCYIVEADSEGWIHWSGGECPLPDDCKVAVILDERIYDQDRAGDWGWLDDALTAYRPILSETAEKEQTEEEWNGYIDADDDAASVFDRLKSAIAASESIPSIIAEIDALLPEGYCVAKREAEQPAEDMSDWRNWREGDLVECLSNHFGFHKKGKIYEIGEDSSGDFGIRDNQGDVLEDFQPYGQCYNSADFRFHSRPAKVAE